MGRLTLHRDAQTKLSIFSFTVSCQVGRSPCLSALWIFHSGTNSTPLVFLLSAYCRHVQGTSLSKPKTRAFDARRESSMVPSPSVSGGAVEAMHTVVPGAGLRRREGRVVAVAVGTRSQYIGRDRTGGGHVLWLQDTANTAGESTQRSASFPFPSDLE